MPALPALPHSPSSDTQEEEGGEGRDEGGDEGVCGSERERASPALSYSSSSEGEGGREGGRKEGEEGMGDLTIPVCPSKTASPCAEEWEGREGGREGEEWAAWMRWEAREGPWVRMLLELLILHGARDSYEELGEILRYAVGLQVEEEEEEEEGGREGVFPLSLLDLIEEEYYPAPVRREGEGEGGGVIEEEEEEEEREEMWRHRVSLLRADFDAINAVLRGYALDFFSSHPPSLPPSSPPSRPAWEEMWVI
jgi:hypothetical protein